MSAPAPVPEPDFARRESLGEVGSFRSGESSDSEANPGNPQNTGRAAAYLALFRGGVLCSLSLRKLSFWSKAKNLGFLAPGPPGIVVPFFRTLNFVF